MAGESDVTQGLPRVEEVFEGRSPKKKAFVSDVRGKVKIEKQGKHKIVTVSYDEPRVIRIYFRRF